MNTRASLLAPPPRQPSPLDALCLRVGGGDEAVRWVPSLDGSGGAFEIVPYDAPVRVALTPKGEYARPPAVVDPERPLGLSDGEAREADRLRKSTLPA